MESHTGIELFKKQYHCIPRFYVGFQETQLYSTNNQFSHHRMRTYISVYYKQATCFSPGQSSGLYKKIGWVRHKWNFVANKTEIMLMVLKMRYIYLLPKYIK
jgi:hypothetical protein